MNWQFTVCTIDEDGQAVEIPDVVTPMVNASNFYEAIAHPDIEAFCKEKLCRIYKIVGR